MKIRNPWLIKFLGFLGALLLRLWIGSLRYRYRPRGPNVDPTNPRLKGRFLYAFWHEDLLIPAYHYSQRNIYVLISQHADGQLIAEACRHLGVGVVRGSTTRGGAEALLQSLQIAQHAHLGITPDGPRGPRRRVQIGPVFLASRTGMPIVPIGFGYSRAWRTRSWDRMALPAPGSAVSCVTLEPIFVPPALEKDQLESYRLRVEEAMNQASDLAQQDCGRPVTRQCLEWRKVA